jgi:hypothetical protein
MPSLSSTTLKRSITLLFVTAMLLAGWAGRVPAVQADGTAQTLPFSQNWSNTGLITTSDDWSGVPGIIGYRGDGLEPQHLRDRRRVRV